MSDNLNDWLNHIESFHPSEIELGLDRIKLVATKLALLKPAAKILLVAGTNGKGSCVATLESLALTQGKNVATYTSPHLLTFNERIRINGNNIDDGSLIEAFKVIESVRGQTTLTFFEFTTLAALYCFSKTTLDLIVLEIGLGGRHDATNIIEPDACIITTVDRDHIDWLGNDLESIAYEKGGIIRSSIPTFVGDAKTLNLLNKVLPELVNETHLIETTDTIDISNPQINQFNLLEQNVVLAKYAYESISDIVLTQNMINVALKNISLSGRFQKLVVNISSVSENLSLGEPSETYENSEANEHNEIKIPVILDVAHNVQSANNLFNQLSLYRKAHQFTHVTAICGMMADKAIEEVLDALDPIIDEWCFVNLELPRAIKASALSEIYNKKQRQRSTSCYESVAEAVKSVSIEYARNSESDNRLILVFGSFITVANMLQYANCLNKTEKA